MSNEILWEENIFKFVDKYDPWTMPDLYGEFIIEDEHVKSLSLFHFLDADNNVQYIAEFEKDTDNVVMIVKHNGNNVSAARSTKTENRQNLEILKDYILDTFQNFLEEKHKEAAEAAAKK
jgi:AICAR transformylase/IMP cyclohydrolase PurH